MVDLSRFDTDTVDTLDGLEEKIVPLLFGDPPWAEQVVPHLEPEYFTKAHNQYIIAGIKKYCEVNGELPTRDMAWLELSKELTVEDPYDEIKAAIYSEPDPREVRKVRLELRNWIRRRIANTELIASMDAIIGGDYDRLRDIHDKIYSIGESEDTLGVIRVSELFQETPEEDWIVDGILAAYQPFIVGGPSKAMKTSVTVDLAIAIASSKPFLGKYKVSKKRRVLLISGESGLAAIRDTAGAILRRRRIRQDEIEDHLFLRFDLPTASTPEGLAEVQALIRAYEVDVVIFDPFYLMLSADEAGMSSNVYAMGGVLGRLCKICISRSITPIILHHFNRKGNPYGWPKLDELTQAGPAEFLRQYLVLKRSREYDGTGKHTINIMAGGHGRCESFQLEIDESDWQTKITMREDLKNEEKTSKQAEKLADEEETLLRAIRILQEAGEPTNLNRIKQQAGWSGTRARRVMDRALELHKVVERDANGQTSYGLLEK